MKKINLFFILVDEIQTNRYEKKINYIVSNEAKGIKEQHTTLEYHFFLLSKHFNLFNFYKFML